jgi:hypothetical protein
MKKLFVASVIIVASATAVIAGNQNGQGQNGNGQGQNGNGGGSHPAPAPLLAAGLPAFAIIGGGIGIRWTLRKFRRST